MAMTPSVQQQRSMEGAKAEVRGLWTVSGEVGTSRDGLSEAARNWKRLHCL